MRKVWIIFALILICFPFRHLFADTIQNTTASLTVPPRTTDYQFTFISTDNTTQFAQGKKLTYQITYGAKTSGNIPSNIKIIADFSNDVASDNTDILDYVNGSATNAYNSTPAVIDTVNRTISWTISSLPAGITDQVVTFQLITNSNYQGSSIVPLTIEAGMSNQYITLPNQTVNQSYIFDMSLVTPTPIPIPTPQSSTPTPIQTAILIPGIAATPTPLLNAVTPTFSPEQTPAQNISIIGITQNSGTIGIQTSLPSTVILFYGTSPNNLTQSISTIVNATYSELVIIGLTAQTNYYFQATTTTQSGQKISSDIFTFKTAVISIPSSIQNGTLVISSNDVIISSQITSTSLSQNTTILQNISVVTKETIYQFLLSFSPTRKIKSIQAIIRNKNTLAMNTFSNIDESNTTVVTMVQTEPGIYVAKIISPFQAGNYEFSARINDFDGNIIEQKITELRVISPFIVYDKGNKEPIDDARVYFYFYNSRTTVYEPLSNANGNIQNPSYSDAKGHIYIPLSKGKYKINVSALGYERVTRQFELGVNSGQDFPQIYLRKDPWNLIYILRYYETGAMDFLIRIGTTIQGLSISLRFFNLIALMTTFSFIFMSFLFFTFRTHISFQRLPVFFHHHLSLLFHSKIHPYIYGTIMDEMSNRVSNASIYILDRLSQDIILSTITNSNGAFYLKHLRQQKILLHILAAGYEELKMEIDTTVSLPQNGISIILHKGQYSHFSGFAFLWNIVKDVLGVLFETTLFLSIVLEFFFLTVFGFWKTMPFFILSLINISLWILYIRESLSRR